MTTIKPFKPMSAATVTDLQQVQLPVLASPKIDGFRAVVCGGRLLSRNLMEFPNKHTQELFSKNNLEGMDGELTVGLACGDGVFSRTSSGVTSIEGNPDVIYHTFDLCTNHHVVRPYAARLYDLNKIFGKLKQRGTVRLVEQTKLETLNDLERYLSEHLLLGYEGAMLRSLHGIYKYGRSTLREQHLMKVKPFEDSEAVVYGYEEGVTNTNETGNAGRRRSLKAGLVPKGTLGALLVRDCVSGVEFRLGTGTMKHVQAAALWVARKKLVGRTAKYKYQKIGSVIAPRQPIFLGWRHEIDL